MTGILPRILRQSLQILLLTVASVTSAAKPQVAAHDFSRAWSRLWDNSYLLIIGGVSTLAVSASDATLVRQVGRLEDQDRLKSAGNDVFGTGIPALVLAAGTLSFGGERAQTLGLRTVEALASSVAVTQAMKLSFGRARPNGADNYSLPSGHTSSIFSTAGVVHGMYDIWHALPFYAMGAVTAISRIASRDHWPSDTVAGAFLGYAIGRAFADPAVGGGGESKNSRFQIVPVVFDECLILNLAARF